jgi:serine/threonine protein kinase/tetratricopeptide (TPR) repeat protein
MGLNPGTLLGRYEIVNALGAGGMGEVYRASDSRLGRDVAIKVMSPQLANDQEWLRRFLQEARATAALSHQNVIAVFDLGVADGIPFVVTELLAGETLRQRLLAGPIEAEQSLEILLQVISGLAAVHARGIIHRDLKPENIYLTTDGQVKILDFGLAKLTKSRPSESSDNDPTLMMTEPGMLLGTMSYLAPEQVRGFGADVRSDLFAVGVILYEMLSGQRPFQGSTSADILSAILKDQPVSLSRRGVTVPFAVERIVERCLEKDAEHRFQSASEVALALRAIHVSHPFIGTQGKDSRDEPEMLTKWLRSERSIATTSSPAPRRVSVSRMPTTGQFLLGRERELSELDEAWQNPDINIMGIVAWGGVGKSALLNHWLARLAKEQYRGAEMVYAWSFYLQGTQDQRMSADDFIVSTLQWFGDKDPNQGSEWEKGVRLAELVASTRTLMILDGLEPLQYSPGPNEGRLKDKSLAAFLRELAGNNTGLCVISSRFAVADLQGFMQTTVRQIDLDHLSPESGTELLRAYGIWGDEEELRSASEEYGGHSLALTLLSTYLRDVHGGDIVKRRGMSQFKQDERKGGHAHRVMESYERGLSDDPALSVLYMLGLFDRPAKPDEIAALRDPPIPGLSDRLLDADADEWSSIVARLRRSSLLLRAHPQDHQKLDAHPLVREYFGERLRQTRPGAWTEANARLYTFFRDNSEDFPQTLQGMEPLMRAVAFGCRAGRYRDALDQVYFPRIMHGIEQYATRVLGANGAVLATAANFFMAGDWGKPILNSPIPDQTVSLEDHLMLLTQVAPSLVTTKGWSSSEVVTAYEKAGDICREIGDTPRLFRVMRGIWSYHSVSSKLTKARELAAELVRAANTEGSKDLRLEANMALGQTEFWLGNFEAAVASLDASLDLYNFDLHHDSHTAIYGEDPGVICLCYKGVAKAVLGFAEQGENVVREALRVCGTLRQSFSKGFALYGCAWFYAQQRDAERTQQYARAVLDLAKEYGYTAWIGLAQALYGWALTLKGDIAEGITEISEGRSAWHSTGGGVMGVFFATLLADACGRANRFDEGLQWIRLAEAAARPEAYYLPEVYRIKAEIVHQMRSAESEVYASIRQSLAIARAQRARLLELRAAVSQYRICTETDMREESAAQLKQILDSFSEGFETIDLVSARAALQELNR